MWKSEVVSGSLLAEQFLLLESHGTPRGAAPTIEFNRLRGSSEPSLY
jgi:hypothetical protein